MLAAILQASLFDRSVLDPDRSVPSIRERGALPDDVKPRSKNCTQHNQFTLHANTYIAPLDRKGLEKMIRYLCRPALAMHRVELLENDEVVRLQLKTPWRDGTTHIRIAAAEFVLRLLALIPAPRKKQFRYLGVFAANAKWRREVVLRPKPPKAKKKARADDAPLAVGDRVVFDDMIHYTMVKTTFFNGVKHPAIAHRTRDGDFRVVREFGYADFRGRLG